MSILDSVLDATSARGSNGSNRVVSENHDTRSINWARGLSDPGEMISCGYMPEARRLAGESDEVYCARLEAMDMPRILGPERMRDLINAAIKRANLDVTGGKVNAVFGSGKSGWHGLGVTLSGTMTAREAMHYAGLDTIKIGKRPMFHKLTDGSFKASEEMFETYREDDDYSYGPCGRLYTPIQIEEQFSFLDSVISEFGAEYETAGSLYHGEQVWIQAHLPKQDFRLNGSTMKALATFVNFNRQGRAGLVFGTDDRIECDNTCRVACDKDGKSGMSIRHSGKVTEKMNDARYALGMTIKGMDEFKQQAEFMYRQPLPAEYFGDVLDLICDISAAQVKDGAEALATILAKDKANADFADLLKTAQRKIDKREGLLEQVIEASQSRYAPAPGTLWNGFNAFTNVASHGKIGKESRDEGLRAERRLESMLVGDRNEMAQAALSVALASR